MTRTITQEQIRPGMTIRMIRTRGILTTIHEGVVKEVERDETLGFWASVRLSGPGGEDWADILQDTTIKVLSDPFNPDIYVVTSDESHDEA